MDSNRVLMLDLHMSLTHREDVTAPSVLTDQ